MHSYTRFHLIFSLMTELVWIKSAEWKGLIMKNFKYMHAIGISAPLFSRWLKWGLFNPFSRQFQDLPLGVWLWLSVDKKVYLPLGRQLGAKPSPLLEALHRKPSRREAAHAKPGPEMPQLCRSEGGDPQTLGCGGVPYEIRPLNHIKSTHAAGVWSLARPQSLAPKRNEATWQYDCLADSAAPDRKGTCGHDDPALVGRHVRGRDVLVLHVAAVGHGGAVSRLPSLPHPTVVRGAPAEKQETCDLGSSATRVTANATATATTMQATRAEIAFTTHTLPETGNVFQKYVIHK